MVAKSNSSKAAPEYGCSGIAKRPCRLKPRQRGMRRAVISSPASAAASMERGATAPATHSAVMSLTKSLRFMNLPFLSTAVRYVTTPRRELACRSHQLLQILETDAQALHRRQIARVALHEKMLHAIFLRGREDGLPVNRPRANLCKVLCRVVLHLRHRESRLAIFQMQQLDALAEALEHVQRVFAGLRHPVTIHFQANQARICGLHQLVEAGGAAKTQKF